MTNEPAGAAQDSVENDDPGAGERSLDRSMELFISNILRSGVALSTVVAVFGLVVFLWHHGLDPALKSEAREAAQLRDVRDIVTGAFHWRPEGRHVMQLGIVLLVLTPIARVFCAAIGFYRRRDMVYVGISLLVLTVLLYGLFFGDPT